MIDPVLPTYARAPVAFEKGEGPWLYDVNGEAYLDFGAGIAVNALGHAHPHLVSALTDQARRLWHTSNLYGIPGGARLAQRLTEASFADTVFFTNSGAEAMECAIKMARKFHSHNGAPERYRIITFDGSFHGRTLATIAAAGQEKLVKGFGPMPEGFDHLPFGDHEALKAAVGPETAAILIEPIQGEGGIRPVPREYLRELRAFCDAQGLLLIFDEIQCGMGRTGRLWAHEHAGITPDILASAKGIGGGFPLGACLATEHAASGMTAGTHGSTYGGNPLAMAVGNAVLDVILEPAFLDHVTEMSGLLRQRLAALQDEFPDIIETVRGEGLMLGLRTVVPNGEFVNRAREQKLLTVPAGDNVVRILPPLNVGAEEIGMAMDRLTQTCRALRDAASIAAKQQENSMTAMNGTRPGRAGAPRHFLDISDVTAADLRGMIDDAGRRKTARKGKGQAAQDDDAPLSGKLLAMIFQKPSTRTRVSFDVGMRQLGGETVVLSAAEMQLGRGETIADTALVLSRYVDAIMIRCGAHDTLTELAEHATVPVINGLTDATHPCQIMADVLTLEEKLGGSKGRKVAWSGDGNNVASSWIHAAERFGFALDLACPETLQPDPGVLRWARERGAAVRVVSDPMEAVAEADCVVADTWLSMGDSDEVRERRHNQLKPYQVNERLMAGAKPGAIFMHCLPAHRGEEATAAVLDGPQSVIFDEAENRLHAQKSILAWCLGPGAR